MGGYKHTSVGDVLTKTEWEANDSHSIRAGTSFPTSPSDGDEFYRTDEHVLYIYDSGASEWKAQGGKKINIEQLINGLDDGIFETLKDTGFEQGDFLPLYTFNPNAERNFSTTSTTYASDVNLSYITILWDDMFPSGVTPQVFGQTRCAAGAGETMALRIYNGTDGETIKEITGITETTGHIETIGPITYTPTTTDAYIWMRWEWKTSPGTNPSTGHTPYISLGVEV